ncbi:GDP-fucose protein O-fucosyltransferase 2 [Pectinophora gossypiella]|nr:GDP-fucose protein O-fucosyltransferase 2 [Pectinophora gossypiella]
MFTFCTLLFMNVNLMSAVQNVDSGYCDIAGESCGTQTDLLQERYIFYDVNPPEGFNLRRDVYMRFATLLAAQNSEKRELWHLVLPPWYRLYHWKSQTSKSKPVHWSLFFDVDSLKSYAPVVELHEVFAKYPNKPLEIDVLFILQNFEDAFEGGTFVEKWEIVKDKCEYDGLFWGYKNITAKEIICVKFQGKISKLWELINLHKSAKKVMFHHAEIPLHNNYGSKSYWECRKSMKFNEELVNIAKNFIRNHLNCDSDKCSSIISIHWRRQDFARSRKDEVPSIPGTVKQIQKFIKKNAPTINKLFVATDASTTEINTLEKELAKLNFQVYFYMPSKSVIDTYNDGGIAIIEQIICSHGAFFIGTHESTFSFRIQEEREILGFDSTTTFNILCPDHGKCEKPSKWTIVN